MHTWAGRSEDELAELGERLFVQGISGSLYPEAWRLVEAHQRAGHTIVLASSATRFQVEPTARAMGVSHILVSPVEIVNGVCTGRPGGRLLWRAAKAAAVRAFAGEHGIDLPQSYAYSNGDEDVPFLQAAGRARAINPGRHLAEAARHYGWPVARFRSRRARVADNAQARKALEPAVQRLRDDISLVIAPEGTRSATPALGSFKKGAFHLALQAGVPIVPIVIRNSGELMWRGATTIHAGTVQVAVLPPVATVGWDAAGLDEHIHRVRGQYLATLANWPAHGTGQVTATTTASIGPPPALPLDWGASPRMNPLETAMWRAESADPLLRVTASLLELLTSAPAWNPLRAALARAYPRFPPMPRR